MKALQMVLFVVKVPILTKAMYMWDDAYSFKIEAFTPGLYDPLQKCCYHESSVFWGCVSACTLVKHMHVFLPIFQQV